MSLRSPRDQQNYEALRFGPPFLDADGYSPQILAVERFAKDTAHLLAESAGICEAGNSKSRKAA